MVNTTKTLDNLIAEGNPDELYNYTKKLFSKRIKTLFGKGENFFSATGSISYFVLQAMRLSDKFYTYDSYKTVCDRILEEIGKNKIYPDKISVDDIFLITHSEKAPEHIVAYYGKDKIGEITVYKYNIFVVGYNPRGKKKTLINTMIKSKNRLEGYDEKYYIKLAKEKMIDWYSKKETKEE